MWYEEFIWEFPLSAAVRAGQIECVKILLAWGANTEAKDGMQMRTALMWAVCSSSHERNMLITLKEGGCSLATTTGEDGETLMHQAAQSGNIETVKLLKEWGLPINAQDCDGYTPAHCSLIRRDNTLVLKQFIDWGADFDDLVSDGQGSVHIAAGCGSCEALIIIKDIGCDINRPDYSGRTPIAVAALGHRQATFKLLLSWGVDIHSRDTSGKTVADLADVAFPNWRSFYTP